jgi:YgiT-type zinc finger domain-containing protein
MECVICKHGNAKQGLVTVTLERENVIIVFKNVSALVCENCGDYYLTDETTNLLLKRASKTLEKGVEFEIINLSSAA